MGVSGISQDRFLSLRIQGTHNVKEQRLGTEVDDQFLEANKAVIGGRESPEAGLLALWVDLAEQRGRSKTSGPDALENRSELNSPPLMRAIRARLANAVSDSRLEELGCWVRTGSPHIDVSRERPQLSRFDICA